MCPQRSGRRIQVFSGTELSKQATPTSTVATDQDGKFCAMLKPGEYVVEVRWWVVCVSCPSSLSSLQPVVSEEEREWGLSLVPPVQEITVSHSPLSTITFSQFTATLTGTLSCIGQWLFSLPPTVCLEVLPHSSLSLSLPPPLSSVPTWCRCVSLTDQAGSTAAQDYSGP